MSAPYHGCKHSAQDWFRDDHGALRCAECEATHSGRRWHDWLVFAFSALLLFVNVTVADDLGSALVGAAGGFFFGVALSAALVKTWTRGRS